MINKIILLILVSFPFGIFAQKTTVTEAEARTVALNWLNTMDKEQDYQVKDVLTNLDYKIGEGLTFYVVRYDNPAFVIVPATKFVRPVLAYSTKRGAGDSFKEGELNGAFYLFSTYNRVVEIHKSTETYMETAQSEWNAPSPACSGANSNYGGAALLEHYHTSRWITRKEVLNCITEFDNWHNPDTADRSQNTCAPLAMSQLMKYYRHPYKGNSSIPSYDYTTHRIQDPNSQVEKFIYYKNAAPTIHHESQIYDYDIMPFKAGSWGIFGGFGLNPNPNPIKPPSLNPEFDIFYPYCDDGTITNREDAPTMSQMGELIFNAGCSVEMMWFRGGTSLVPKKFGNAMHNYFNYNFIPNNSISTVTFGTSTVLPDSAFKNKIRASLLNERPVIFSGCTIFPRGGGHTFIIDGFQCDNFFHVALGIGGEHDGYYCLFSAEANGTYGHLVYQYTQLAEVDIHPNCNLVPDITINNKTYTSQELEQAQNNITASNSTVQAGAKTFMIGGNSVELTSDFEVELGAELFINVETCGVPKQGH